MRVSILAIALLLAMPGVMAQETGVSLVVLVHHPYPDAADPLGFPFPSGSDTGYFVGQYAHLDREGDGFDFPYAVFDGVLPIEGLPDPSAPYVSTRDAYNSAYAERVGDETPVTLQIATQVGDGSLLAAVRAEPVVPIDGERLRLWTALVEDHVYYNPPSGLSNGVTDHRFTVRAMQDHGPVDLTSPASATASYAFEGDPGTFLVAAWLQQEPSDGLRFDAHEVVQAAVHPIVQAAPTVQAEKAVLMQLYSATWCDPCLFGDRAAEELAAEHSVQVAEPAQGPTYWSPPPIWVLLAALAAGLGVATVRWPGGPE